MLHRLGFQLGVTLWQDAWRRAMLPPPAQPQPSTTALVSAAAGTHQPASQAGTVHAVLDQLLGRDTPQLQDSVASGIPNSISHDAVSPMQTDATSAPGAGQQSVSVSPDNASQRCMAIIQQIRREEFGMNVELDAASSQLRHRQNERIGRALQRLSQELYSKDTHFVLELVQNADDNSYPAGVLPALEFILQGSGITVLNNEVHWLVSKLPALSLDYTGFACNACTALPELSSAEHPSPALKINLVYACLMLPCCPMHMFAVCIQHSQVDMSGIT